MVYEEEVMRKAQARADDLIDRAGLHSLLTPCSVSSRARDRRAPASRVHHTVEEPNSDDCLLFCVLPGQEGSTFTVDPTDTSSAQCGTGDESRTGLDSNENAGKTRRVASSICSSRRTCYRPSDGMAAPRLWYRR